ncbi:MAG: hypothetical protein R2912_01190 [Eubacteriales bacterium]
MKTLVVIVCTISSFFVFYLLALVQSKKRREMDKRVQALFGTQSDAVMFTRSKQGKKRTQTHRVERIAEELYVAGVALRAEEFITIWILTSIVIPRSRCSSARR